jgi:hypothetical protein
MIPSDAIIPWEKLTQYLLAPRARNDKSRFLNNLGFPLDAPDLLAEAIRRQARSGPARVDARDEYGDRLIVDGPLSGPTGTLHVRTVWIRRTGESVVRFVTRRPSKEPA